MQLSAAEITSWVGSFLWPFMRIGALFLAAPLFSGRMVSARVRLLLTLALTWVIALVLPPAPAVEPLSFEGLMIGLQQILIGLVMGFAIQIVFAAVAFGGQVIAYSMGLGFASMVDPANGVQVPVVSQYFIVLLTLAFLMLNGHLILIEMLADSFRTLPIGVDGITRNDLWTLIGWGTRMFSGGLLMALPAVVALLLINLTFGVVTRAAPQLNIFAVGFPVAILLGFLILWAALPNVLEHFSELLDSAFVLIRSIVAKGG